LIQKYRACEDSQAIQLVQEKILETIEEEARERRESASLSLSLSDYLTPTDSNLDLNCVIVGRTPEDDDLLVPNPNHINHHVDDNDEDVDSSENDESRSDPE
jgi:hypothetical protein